MKQQDNGIELPPTEPTFDQLKAQLLKATDEYHEHPAFQGAVLSGVMLIAQHLLRNPNSTIITPANILQAAREIAQDKGFLAVTANAKD